MTSIDSVVASFHKPVLLSIAKYNSSELSFSRRATIENPIFLFKALSLLPQAPSLVCVKPLRVGTTPQLIYYLSIALPCELCNHLTPPDEHVDDKGYYFLPMDKIHVEYIIPWIKFTIKFTGGFKKLRHRRRWSLANSSGWLWRQKNKEEQD